MIVQNRAKKTEGPKKTYRIGLDLDRTLVSMVEPTIKVAARNLNIKSYPKPADYWYSNLPEELRNEIFRLYDDPDHATNLKIISRVPQKLWDWRKQGHTLIIITARNQAIRRATTDWVQTHLPMIHKIRFVDMKTSKADAFKEEEIDVWIDDSPFDTVTAHSMGIRTYLISNNETPFNWDLKNNCPFRIYTSTADINFY